MTRSGAVARFQLKINAIERKMGNAGLSNGQIAELQMEELREERLQWEELRDLVASIDSLQ